MDKLRKFNETLLPEYHNLYVQSETLLLAIIININILKNYIDYVIYHRQ